MLVPYTETSEREVVGAVSTAFALVMAKGSKYVFSVVGCDCYIKQSAAATAASAADGSVLVPAGSTVPLAGERGARLTVIRAGAVSGEATLCKASSGF